MNIARIRPQRSQKHSHGTHTRPIWILKYIIIDVCPWNMVKFEYEFFFLLLRQLVCAQTNERLSHILTPSENWKSFITSIYYCYFSLSLFASIFNSAFIVLCRATVPCWVCVRRIKVGWIYTKPVAANQEWTRRVKKNTWLEIYAVCKFANWLPFRHFFRTICWVVDACLCWSIFCRVCYCAHTAVVNPAAAIILLYNIRSDGCLFCVVVVAGVAAVAVSGFGFIIHLAECTCKQACANLASF